MKFPFLLFLHSPASNVSRFIRQNLSCAVSRWCFQHKSTVTRYFKVPVIILPDIGKALGQNLGDVQWEWCSNDLIQRTSFHHMIFNSFIDACYCNELFTVSLDWGNGWSLQVCETRIRCKAISPASLCIKVADGFRSQAMWNMFAKGTLPPKKRVSKKHVWNTSKLSANPWKNFPRLRPSLDGPLCIRQFDLLCSTFEVHVMKRYEQCFLSTHFYLKKLIFARL